MTYMGFNSNIQTYKMQAANEHNKKLAFFVTLNMKALFANFYFEIILFRLEKKEHY